jgi:ubiquinone/menaquinone biosynthesis C-methylase UbiE
VTYKTIIEGIKVKSDTFKNKSKKQFDKWAENYDAEHKGSNVDHEISQLIDNINCESILDVGCGDGRLLEILKRDRRMLNGIDISSKMIKIAEKKLSDKARLVVGDSEFLPWPDDEFDAIICAASFHHYPKPKAVLKEMVRVLKQGGVLLIAELYFPNLIRIGANAIMPLLKYGVYHFYSRHQMENLFRQIDLKDITCKRVRNYFIMYAKK